MSGFKLMLNIKTDFCLVLDVRLEERQRGLSNGTYRGMETLNLLYKKQDICYATTCYVIFSICNIYLFKSAN